MKIVVHPEHPAATSSFLFNIIGRGDKVSTEVIKRGLQAVLTAENPIPPGFVGFLWNFLSRLNFLSFLCLE